MDDGVEDIPGDNGAGERLSACHFCTSDRRANERLRVDCFDDVESRIFGIFMEDFDELESVLFRTGSFGVDPPLFDTAGPLPSILGNGGGAEVGLRRSSDADLSRPGFASTSSPLALETLSLLLANFFSSAMIDPINLLA